MEFGQTLVLGGLIQTRMQSAIQKVPLLGELPGVGAAFSKKQVDQSEVELIIMITPEYVSPMLQDQMPPIGPGRTTTFPTDRELYCHGLIEVPVAGPECGQPGGACDPNFSVNVKTDTPWAGGAGGNYGTPTMAPTTVPAAPPAPSGGMIPPSGGGGLIAPGGAGGPVETVPPPPAAGDSGVSMRKQTPRNMTKSIPSRFDNRSSVGNEGATQANFKTTKRNTDNAVQPASATQPADSKQLPNPGFR
jgi:pilus assembly protein CpaC